MNVLDLLTKKLNEMPDLPQHASMGFLQAADAFSIYPTKSGQVIEQDFDGNQEIRLYYEAAIRTQDQQKGNALMWSVSGFVNNLKTLDSAQFRFLKAEATSEPSISQADAQGFFVYTFDFAVNVMTHKNL